MTPRIGITTSGLWRLRNSVELLTGGRAKRCRSTIIGVEVLAGWGHKPTAFKARQVARQRNLPYVAFEDGFLRSVLPGDGEMPVGMVMDRTGHLL